jgi:hypothetical protein
LSSLGEPRNGCREAENVAVGVWLDPIVEEAGGVNSSLLTPRCPPPRLLLPASALLPLERGDGWRVKDRSRARLRPSAMYSRSRSRSCSFIRLLLPPSCSLPRATLLCSRSRSRRRELESPRPAAPSSLALPEPPRRPPRGRPERVPPSPRPPALAVAPTTGAPASWSTTSFWSCKKCRCTCAILPYAETSIEGAREQRTRTLKCTRMVPISSCS